MSLLPIPLLIIPDAGEACHPAYSVARTWLGDTPPQHILLLCTTTLGAIAHVQEEEDRSYTRQLPSALFPQAAPYGVFDWPSNASSTMRTFAAYVHRESHKKALVIASGDFMHGMGCPLCWR